MDLQLKPRASIAGGEEGHIHSRLEYWLESLRASVPAEGLRVLESGSRPCRATSYPGPFADSIPAADRWEFEDSGRAKCMGVGTRAAEPWCAIRSR